MSELVTREDRGRVSILTLNNPPANGYSYAMHRALDAHVLDLRMDRGTDVIVLRGAGERFFCAGADINYLQGLDPEEKYSFCLFANETLLRLENTPKLVIAALNGHCVGGGLEVALACDLRIGRASGAKPNLVGLPEVSLGVLPGTGGTQRLTRILGRARALQWMIEGKNVSVEEAAEIGLVHTVLPAEGWWDAVLAYAATFTRPGRAAGAVGLIKRAVLGGADASLETGLALERELQMRLFSAPDAKEGLAAFLEKRPAVFTGTAHGAGGPPATPPPARPAPATRADDPAPRDRVFQPSGTPEVTTRVAPVAASAPAAPSAPTAPPPIAPAAPAASFGAHADSAKSGLGGFGAHSDTAESGFGGWAGSGKAEPGSALTHTPAHPDRDYLAHPHAPDPAKEPIPSEFQGFEDFADFGPEESELGAEAFGSVGGHPNAEATPGKIDLHRTRIPDVVLNLLPRDIVERFGVIPVKRTESTLLVAMVDPANAKGLDAIREQTGLEVQAVRASELDIGVMIGRYYRA
jgi:enoyl-CoA hydratase